MSSRSRKAPDLSQGGHVQEQKARSLLKALSWRFLATTTTMLIVFIYTRELALSFGVGALEVVAKMALYYGHERAWGRIGWGQSRDSAPREV